MPKAIDFTGQKIGRLTVLEKTDKKSGTCIVWKCLCDCGNITYVSSQNLSHKTTLSCGCLQKEKAKLNTKDITGQKFGRLTALKPTNKRKNNSVIWICECECGNIIEIDEHSLTRKTKGRKSCGCLLKDKSKEAASLRKKNLIGKRIGKLTVIAEDNSKNRTHWFCMCDCGNIVSEPTFLLTSNSILSCGCIKSKGEEKIINILAENQIKFETQKTFDSCRFKDTNAMALFDFYVNDKYLIEYDGIMHYETQENGWNNSENLQKIQEHDNFKNQWCKENNIPLIRIPYTHFENLCLEDLMLETSKFIIQ